MPKTSKNRYVDLMLDSGAFSAWSRGTSIDLQTYIDYVQEHKHLFHSYVNLDKIPGEFGRKRSMDQVEESARVSYENLQVMKSQGLKPIPVFHQDESFKWLERMLSDGEKYIGFSSGKDLQMKQKRQWLDTVFSMITDSKGRPYIKTHGFGITTPGLLFRYPWFTVDSTTWALAAGYGKIMCPVYIDGKPDYTRLPINVIVSGVEQKSSSSQRMQFEALGPQYQDCVVRFVEEEVGANMTLVRNSAIYRHIALLTYYRSLVENYTVKPFEHRRKSTYHVERLTKLRPVKIEHFNIMHAANFGTRFAHLLTEAGIQTRLLSYYELRDFKTEALEHYIKTGRRGPYVRQRPKPKWDAEAYLSFRRLKMYDRLEGLADVADDSTG